MEFASDNSGPVHPAILNALSEANEGFAMAYGADPWTEAATEAVRGVFEAPDAAVYLVATGTAANALILATLAQPWSTLFCGRAAHIHEDECNAPEFYTGGAKLTLVGAAEDRFTADELRVAMAKAGTSVHAPQRGPVSVTSVSERGSVLGVDEIRAIADVAHEFGSKLHLDGARFANACAALGVSPAEMTWKAGVDAVSFGGTKNGCMGVEAAVIFDPDLAWEFELRRKRAAHLFSKSRYLGAQMAAYLAGDLWLTMARQANAAADLLRQGLDARGIGYLWRGDANMVFPQISRARHRALRDAGARYHLWDGDLEGSDDGLVGCRLVCDWSIGEDGVQRFLDLL